MARFITEPGASVGTLRVGTTESGEPVLADLASGAYETEDEEHAAVLRNVEGVKESQDAPTGLTPELLDVRLPGQETLAPGAPRSGVGERVVIPIEGDRTDGGEAAGQIVTGKRARQQAPLEGHPASAVTTAGKPSVPEPATVPGAPVGPGVPAAP